MPLAEGIPDEWEDPCDFARRWGISYDLALRLQAMAARLEFGVSIISGLRTPEEQDALRRSGKPTAPNDLSTHLACPATGADVWPDVAPVSAVRGRLGAEAVFAGLRWGGGSPTDPDTAMPTDWNHFDLGPR